MQKVYTCLLYTSNLIALRKFSPVPKPVSAIVKCGVLSAVSYTHLSMRCVGYRQALEHLAGEYDLAELRERGIFATRQLAKRQLTWLRGMDDVVEMDCLNPQLNELVFNEINQYVKNNT